MNKIISKIVLLSGLMLGMPALQADDDIKITRSGIGSGFQPYIGVAVGSANYDEAGGDDMSLSLFGGLALNEVLSLELSWNDFGDGGDSRASAEASSLGLAIVGNLPFGSEVTGFARLGLNRWSMDVENSDDSGTDLFFGLGIDYTIAGRSAVRFAIDVYPMDAEFSGDSYDEQLNVFNVGFIYRL